MPERRFAAGDSMNGTVYFFSVPEISRVLSPSFSESLTDWTVSTVPPAFPRRASIVDLEMWGTRRYSEPAFTLFSAAPTGMQVNMSIVPSVNTGSGALPASSEELPDSSAISPAAFQGQDELFPGLVTVVTWERRLWMYT